MSLINSNEPVQDWLDEAYLKILRELQLNGRASVSSIAKKLEMRRSTVNDRINRLVDRKIIKGFTAIPNFEALGFPITAFVLVELTPAAERDVPRREIGELVLQKFPTRIREIHSVTGDFDLLLKLRGRTLPELGDIIERLQRSFPISRTRTFVAYRSAVEELSHPLDLVNAEMLKKGITPFIL